MQIEVKLNKDFERAFMLMKEKYGEDFENLNSLSEKDLGFTTFIDSFKKSKLSDISADPSSAVKSKDIVSLRSEMKKPHEKLIAANKIFQEMKVDWGLRTAKKWFEAEWSKALYLHDFNTSTFVHYCYAYDLKRIAEEGLFYLPEHDKPEPAKHLETFIDFVKEFINFASNRSSGATGLPNLIVYMYWFWWKDVQSGHYCRSHTPEKFAKSEIQRMIYAMNQPYTRDGIQSAFINTSIFDESYFEALFGGSQFPDGEYMIDHEEGILEFQKWFLEEMKSIKDNGRIFTYPVNTISLLVDENNELVNKEFAKWCSDHNRYWNDSNLFVDSEVTSLSNCCRLKSNIKDLGYMNSIGGSGLKVGSVKVSTVNLARIAYESGKNEKKYLELLKDRLILDMKVLHTIRKIIAGNVDKGFLPNFTDGVVDFEHLYNTIGINGIYETLKFMGYTEVDEFGNTFYKDEAFEFGKQIFELIHDVIEEFTADKDYSVNVEQIPAETAAVKFLQADKLLFGERFCNVEHICTDEVYHFTLNGIEYCIPSKDNIVDDYNIKEILDKGIEINIEDISKYIVEKNY